MGHQSKDVESLQESGRRRGSCLDIFLVVSVVSLFVTLAALTAGGLMVVMDLRSQLKPPREVHPPNLGGDAPSPTNKAQRYAYLEATSSTLKNSTMSWAKVYHGSWESVGSNFDFDQTQHSLRPKQEGTYFMYIDLNLTCTYTNNCNAGLLKVHVGDKLTCEVELPVHSASVSRKCWTVSWLSDEKLFTQMTVPEGGLNNWKLELNSSGFGVFLVE